MKAGSATLGIPLRKAAANASANSLYLPKRASFHQNIDLDITLLVSLALSSFLIHYHLSASLLVVYSCLCLRAFYTHPAVWTHV